MAASEASFKEEPVKIFAGDAALDGNLAIPEGAAGVVLFAHGSGSSRFSPRNRFVSRELYRAGCATLLMDLLTPHEETVDAITAELRFDIDLLADRLAAATEWLKSDPRTRNLAIGYFGASTGAAAALIAAARLPGTIKAIVSRGGRPDLAMPVLGQVQAPTLLIVGGNDTAVIVMNQEAFDKLEIEKEMKIVPGATHLFEEEGALEEVARLAADWFHYHLGKAKASYIA